MVANCYVLARGVSVRSEKFGLLFYDYRGPRLYFVPSRDWIPPEFFDGTENSSDLVEKLHEKHGWSTELIGSQLNRIFQMLESKGLINEQSLC
jgi:putative mycofactocin binding protein MftB